MRPSAMDRSYESAVRILDSRRLPLDLPVRTSNSTKMEEWLGLMGYSVEDINRLNIIHVAGTNGKGSTCSFTQSFLLSHAKTTGYPQKVGLYTGPHMKHVRERICINGQPISKELFAKRFFEMWECFPEMIGRADWYEYVPHRLRLLCLLSYHVFLTENVDVAIYEAHVGGEYDATNVVRNPIITAITSIGMDHMNVLGTTIENIAWHKAGIFKTGSLAFSTVQPPEVAEVFRLRAKEKNVEVEFVAIDDGLPLDARALQQAVQKQNCSLALAVVRAWLHVTAPAGRNIITAGDIKRGVEDFYWPGRFHMIDEGACRWFLDGAHNEHAVEHAVQWYAMASSEIESHVTPLRILIFAQNSKRDGIAIMRRIFENLQATGIDVQHVIITSYNERQDGRARIDIKSRDSFPLELQERYVATWREFDSVATVWVEQTIEEALNRARGLAGPNNCVRALVMGSLYLVAGALCLLEPDLDGLIYTD